ncbi:hypothetical protein ISF_07124 [Cordyceps fumosorosea ARSEF 2679]|uniref:DUF7730 domain-containing protein n=1 Tax=Cordyceps fumosorosea (strain ARSEF 2679) TaxID=1081104 RepID=A0A167Q1Q1_CORFA|nr:hypothetical protein ISF_07124 [Cordyceps fumosorosea ARSEF 2679]OAA57203.1 hypothetical protein ISF_07124 [Cordyceps fumosorosea ARSEF 2679]
MDTDAEAPVFRSNLIPGPPATTTNGYTSPPPSPRLHPHEKPIVQTSALLLLPAEIRILILVAAFGDRTIHVDLEPVFLSDTATTTTTSTTSRSRPSTPPDGPEGGPQRHWDLVDLSSPQIQWKPSGHLCHRRCFESRHAPPPIFVIDRDRCFTGSAARCGLPAYGLASCRVGALGWLLTCRQAHAESLAVLYRRNTFRLNESLALENVPRILPHHRDITRLSLSLTMGRPPPRADRVAYPRPRDAVEHHLVPLLAPLPEAFPALTHLHVVLAGELWPEAQIAAYCAPSAALHARVEAVLAWVERCVVRRCAVLRRCEVAFDSSVYFPWLQVERGLEIDFKDYADFEQCPYAVWRPLAAAEVGDGGDDGTIKSVTDRSRLSGYWVCLDAWDAIPWSVMTDLYGTGPW